MLMMSEWPEARLGDLTLKIGSGATPRGGKSVYQTTGVAFIRSQNVYDNRFSFAGLAHITDGAARDLSGVAVKQGDVLINITGESVTRTCQVDPAALPARVSQHVAIIRPDPTRLDAGYLMAALLEPTAKNRLNMLSSAGATRRALTKGHLASFEIPLPPLEEQQRISSFLGALTDLINTNRRLSADLEGLLAARFARGRFDQPSSDGGRLGELVAINPLYAKPKDDAPYIDMAALPTDRARVTSVSRRPPMGGARFMNGDTVMARITPCLENGKTAFIDLLEHDEVGIGSTEFIVLRSSGALGAHWSYFLARSPRFREYAVQHMSGTSGRQRCPADAIERYSIAKPDPAAASAFARIAETLFVLVKGLEEEAKEAANAHDELLPLLLSGRVLVGDLAA